MTELRVEGGGRRRPGRIHWTGRMRWYGLALVVMLLCGATYLLGIWVGMRTHVTCTTTAPGQIVCGTTEEAPVDRQPLRPPIPPQEGGSA